MASEGQNGVTRAENTAPENGTLNGDDVQMVDHSDKDELAENEDENQRNQGDGMPSKDNEIEQVDVGGLTSEDDETQQLEGLSPVDNHEDEVKQPLTNPEADVSSGGDTERATDEDSPSHTPGGTPITKHVQFEEISDPGDAEIHQSEGPADDRQTSTDVQQPVSEDGYDDSTDVAITDADGDANGRGDAGADKEQSGCDEDFQTVAPSVAVPAINSNGTPTGRDGYPDDSKSTPRRTSPQVSESNRRVPMSDDMRCKWGCCCGVGWFMVGLVSAVIGVMLVVYLKQFWKSTSNPNESLLLYFGIGACVLGVLTFLVGLSFWSCACIMWKPSGYMDVERQTIEQDTDSTTKVKNIKRLDDDYVTSDNKGNSVYYVNSKENAQQNTSTTPVTDETFLV